MIFKRSKRALDTTENEPEDDNSGRGPKLSEEERKQVLKGDKYVRMMVDEFKVQCGACFKMIKLSKDRTAYELKNWNGHKKRCVGIIGKKRPRTDEDATPVSWFSCSSMSLADTSSGK